jgi:hypothetical protein
MKKLSLEMLRLTSEEVLGRSQMKKITGGYGGSGSFCTVTRCSSTVRCCPGEMCSDASEYGWCK